MSRRTRPPTDGVEMRLTPAMLVLASILISGCASQSVDCAMGVGHNRCTPGTKEYEQMMQKQQDQQDAKTAAEIDDARCRSYGRRDHRSMLSVAAGRLKINGCSGRPVDCRRMISCGAAASAD